MYFDSLSIEYIPQEVLIKMKDKSITHNIFRIPSDDSSISGFYCIGFIEYLLQEKSTYSLLASIKRMTR